MEKYSNIINDFNDLDNNKLDNTGIKFNSNNYSFDVESFIDVINNNYKQIILFILVFVIIYVVDHITYYNALFYGLASSLPPTQQPQQPQMKSNTFKKNPRKNRK